MNWSLVHLRIRNKMLQETIIFFTDNIPIYPNNEKVRF